MSEFGFVWMMSEFVDKTDGFVNFHETRNVQCVGAYFNSEICSVWCHGYNE